MTFLTIEQILQLHSLVIQKTGGSDGVRDMGRLQSAVATQQQEVFGQELYPSLYDKAAALIRAIIADHAFVDGNKRTGMLAGLTLMEVNGVRSKITEGALEDFAVQVAVEHMEVVAIAEWLQEHSSG